jgi:hypothetical protein
MSSLFALGEALCRVNWVPIIVLGLLIVAIFLPSEPQCQP